MKPQNFAEKVVWYSAIGTYGLYFLGAQYIFIPAIAWLLTLYLCKQIWQQTQKSSANKITIPWSIWVWIVSMLILELALIMGHIDFDLGLTKTIFSSINNWARQYALLALFPLIGYLNIRPQILYRAACIICLQSLILAAISCLIFALHLPHIEYVSPLAILGGGSDELYSVDFYEIEYGTNLLRLKLFAPWCPELGMIANIYFFLAFQEHNYKWRIIGVVGAITMIIGSFSRAAILCLPLVITLVWVIGKLAQPITYITLAIASFITSIFTPQLINFIQTSREQFDSFRSSSSEVRGLLVNLALDRWYEAPIWGHGVVTPWLNTPGIGTHHTWVGLLFIRGIVGFFAFATPLFCSFIDLLFKVQKSITAKVGMSIILILFIFSSVIDISYIVHLYWLGLVMLGISLKEQYI
ncbi:capsular biosynthesis protein [Chroogloeocystis siderophila 5.2 s.c.1]|uniref:Capsular biosynthesis protein n=2 Tax=Chroogloeocystis TaxID=329162 RepID=A0A1U7HQL6_9CHRO|nr:capsular biosynthesis protein [Chroogloeocystis siderophila 5.2 s.c.1]